MKHCCFALSIFVLLITLLTIECQWAGGDEQQDESVWPPRRSATLIGMYRIEFFFLLVYCEFISICGKVRFRVVAVGNPLNANSPFLVSQSSPPFQGSFCDDNRINFEYELYHFIPQIF